MLPIKIGDRLIDIRQPEVVVFVDEIENGTAGDPQRIVGPLFRNGRMQERCVRVSVNELFERDEKASVGYWIERRSAPEEGTHSPLASKLESIISGYRMNPDDASWIRAAVGV